MANNTLLAEKQAEIDGLLVDLDTVTQLSRSFLDSLNDPTFQAVCSIPQATVELATIREKLAQLRGNAQALGHARLTRLAQATTTTADNTAAVGADGTTGKVESVEQKSPPASTTAAADDNAATATDMEDIVKLSLEALTTANGTEDDPLASMIVNEPSSVPASAPATTTIHTSTTVHEVGSAPAAPPPSIFELARSRSSNVQTLFNWKATFRQNAHAAAAAVASAPSGTGTVGMPAPISATVTTVSSSAI